VRDLPSFDNPPFKEQSRKPGPLTAFSEGKLSSAAKSDQPDAKGAAVLSTHLSAVSQRPDFA
jgi:hypothetical protein